MRMIAGLIAPSGGSIAIKGKPVNQIPVHKRNVGMLFQNYALFPHLTVAHNIAFGLEMRELSKADALKQGRRRARDGAARRASARAIRISSPAASSSASRWRARW